MRSTVRVGGGAETVRVPWGVDQGEELVPIPGTKRRKYREENIHAVEIKLSPEQVRELNDIFPPGAASGPRYPEAMMASVNR